MKWTNAIALLLAVVALTGCPEGAPSDSVAPTGIEEIIEQGPLHLKVSTSAETITTAETLVLRLTATVDDGYTVEFPPYPEAVNEDATDSDAGTTEDEPPQFTVANIEDLPPVLGEDGRVTRARIYHLEPFLDGTYPIPPLPVSYWKEVEGEDQKSTAETKAMEIPVASVLAPSAPPEVQAIVGPRDVSDPFPWLKWLLALTALLVIAAGAWWYKFVRQVPGPPPAPPVPPHLRALEALEALQREKLVEKGEYKTYYIRVSDILRHYMEDQFQLRAPERTTEEFLAEIQHNAVLGLQEQLLLRSFLRHCDLVKFARAEPSAEEIRETFSTCRQFIVDSEAAHRAALAASVAAEA